jgi:hypothetical protein
VDGEPSPEARVAAGALLEASKAMREMCAGLEAGAAALLQLDREETAIDGHVCSLPKDAPAYTMVSCGCGKRWRLYPQTTAQPGWRET